MQHNCPVAAAWGRGCTSCCWSQPLVVCQVKHTQHVRMIVQHVATAGMRYALSSYSDGRRAYKEDRHADGRTAGRKAESRASLYGGLHRLHAMHVGLHARLNNRRHAARVACSPGTQQMAVCRPFSLQQWCSTSTHQTYTHDLPAQPCCGMPALLLVKGHSVAPAVHSCICRWCKHKQR
jgi:hypothetical protein